MMSTVIEVFWGVESGVPGYHLWIEQWKTDFCKDGIEFERACDGIIATNQINKRDAGVCCAECLTYIEDEE